MEEREALDLVGTPKLDSGHDPIYYVDVGLVAQKAKAMAKLRAEKIKAPNKLITIEEAAKRRGVPKHRILLQYLEHNMDLQNNALVWICEGKDRKLRQSAGVVINGERFIDVLGVRYPAAQLIWLFRTGDWSISVQHVDGNKLNNSAQNLHSINSGRIHTKHKLLANSTSGHRGVSFNADRVKFYACIHINRKTINLGWHSTLEEAIKARADAEIRYNIRAEYKQKRKRKLKASAL